MMIILQCESTVYRKVISHNAHTDREENGNAYLNE